MNFLRDFTKEDLENAEIKGNIFWRGYDDEIEDESCETKTENDESEEEDDGSDDNFIPEEEGDND